MTSVSFIILFVVVVVIGAFVDACVQPSTAFKAAGKSKGGWIALIVLFGIFAAVPYLVVARPAVINAK